MSRASSSKAKAPLYASPLPASHRSPKQKPGCTSAQVEPVRPITDSSSYTIEFSYHEIDRAPPSKDIRTWNNSPSTVKVLRWPRVIERSGLRVQLHVPGVDAGTIDPKRQMVINSMLDVIKVYAHHGLFKLSSPASINRTERLWSRLAKRPAGTQPALPPPQMMMSTSSGMVMVLGGFFDLTKLRRLQCQ